MDVVNLPLTQIIPYARKAAEHLVCADLMMSGYRAFLSDQGLPYDILVDVNGSLLRVQVKSTRRPKTMITRLGLRRDTCFLFAGHHWLLAVCAWRSCGAGQHIRLCRWGIA